MIFHCSFFVRKSICSFVGFVFVTRPLFLGFLRGTASFHFVFPLIHIDESGEVMYGRCPGIHGHDFPPGTVLTPLIVRRFRFLEPRDQRVRFGWEVPVIGYRVTFPSIDPALDVILIRFGDQRIGRFVYVFEFERRFVEDAPYPLRLFVHVDPQDHMYRGPHGCLQRYLRHVSKINCVIDKGNENISF